MDAWRSVAFRYFLPTIFVASVPWLWSDSGASQYWEFFDIPPGFADRLLPITLFLAAILGAQLRWLDRRAGESGDRDTLIRPRWNFWFFLAVLAVFMVRGLQHADIFPVHPFGETNSAILGAKLAETYGPLSAYNTGFGLLFNPFFEWFGPSFPLVRWLTVGTWGLSLIALLALFSTLHRGANNVLVFVPPVLVAMILPSLRTYTWHAGAAVASVAAFFFVAALASRRSTKQRVLWGALGVLFYAIGFSAYHAVVVFLPLVLLMAALSFGLDRRFDRTAWILVAVVLVLAISSVHVIRNEFAHPLQNRVHFELGDVRPNWSKTDNLFRSWDNFFYSFLWNDASFPIRVLFLTGLVAAMRSFRSCLFARTALVLFVGLYAAQFPLWGHSDWSQNCYTIIPIVGLLAVALHKLARTLALIRPAWAYGAMIAAALIAISAVEYRHYYEAGLFHDRQYAQNPHDTATQLSLALRDTYKTIAKDPNVVVLMPALHGPKQTVAFDASSLDWLHPRSRRLLSRVRYFTSADDLHRQVYQIRESGHPIRVYFGYPHESAIHDLAPYLVGLPDATLVQQEPYGHILHPYVRLLVTYVDVPPLGAGPSSVRAREHGLPVVPPPKVSG